MPHAPDFAEPPRDIGTWVTADRLSVIADAQDYFSALAETIPRAKTSIKIVGWDVDGRTDLEPEKGLILRDLLTKAADDNPDLEISILQWDFAFFYALEREWLPGMQFDWRGHPQIVSHLDSSSPPGASHHEKLVIIDDALAFLGGIDLTTERWDTSDHDPASDFRVSLNGKSYGPWHDLQVAMSGAPARALAEIVKDRWTNAGGKLPRTVEQLKHQPDDGQSLWPSNLEPDFDDAELCIALTRPSGGGQSGKNEVEDIHLHMISQAKRFIYLENQYFTADDLIDALVRRMQEVPALAVIVVTPAQLDGMAEDLSMNAGRFRSFERFRDAGLDDRLLLLHPVVIDSPGEAADDHNVTSITVHAKAMFVDGTMFRLGSANFSNRSMGLDSECDIAVYARNQEDRNRIEQVTGRLLGEHMGCPPEEAIAVITADDILARLEDMRMSDGRRQLHLIEQLATYDTPLAHALSVVGDPAAPPTRLGSLSARLRTATSALRVKQTVTTGSQDAGRSRTELAVSGMAAATRVVAAAGVLLLLLTLLVSTPAADWMGLESGADGWTQWEPDWQIYAAGSLLIVLLGFVAFPLGPVVALAGFILGWQAGFIIGLVGGFASSVLYFVAGRRMKSRVLKSLLSSRTQRIIKHLSRRGAAGIAALRAVPVAPFSLVNLAAGASAISFSRYLIGTCASLVPAILLLALIGDRLWFVWQSPSLSTTIHFSLAVAGLVLHLVCVSQLTSWLAPKRGG